MKRILVPTDFSKASQFALETAGDIALKSGSEILLLHVVEEASGNSFNVEGEVQYDNSENKLFTMKLIERARKQLDKQANDTKLNGVKIKQVLRLGSPFHGIQTILTEQKVDLVVMGTTEKTLVAKIVLGSNTEKIVRYAHCPVLTLHKKPASSDFKNIVYATSLHADEEIFSRMVKETQKLYDSTIHLLHINTPANFKRDIAIKKQMQDFAKKLQLKNSTLNIFNDYSEEQGIIYFADHINADMIALATHGRTGFAHVISGSIAEEVSGHSKRPVLTFVIKRREK